jgi:hypothetical protein
VTPSEGIALIAGFYYWIGKISVLRFPETLAQIHFWILCVLMCICIQAVTIMHNRGSTPEECAQLGSEMVKYQNGTPPYNMPLDNAISAKAWWEFLKTALDNPLISLALLLLSISPSAAFVERVFSIMGLCKTKLRNRMSVRTLGKLATVRVHRLNEMHNKDNAGR